MKSSVFMVLLITVFYVFLFICASLRPVSFFIFTLVVYHQRAFLFFFPHFVFESWPS